MNVETYEREEVVCGLVCGQRVIAGPEAWSLVAMGLAGEAGEAIDLLKKDIHHHRGLDREHYKKELGDVLWYVALAYRLMNRSLPLAFKRAVLPLHWTLRDRIAIRLAMKVGEVCSHIEDLVCGLPPGDHRELADVLEDVIAFLIAAAHLEGITIEEVMQANIEKLRKRFPNGWSPEAAAAKADEAAR